jgi:hypothetical protein
MEVLTPLGRQDIAFVIPFWFVAAVLSFISPSEVRPSRHFHNRLNRERSTGIG